LGREWAKILGTAEHTVWWLILSIGVVHCCATFRYHSALTEAALWFFCAGLALVYAALLNLSRLRGGAESSFLSWACRTANVSLAGFVLVFAGRKWEQALRDPASLLLTALVITGTMLSFRRRRRPDRKPRVHPEPGKDKSHESGIGAPILAISPFLPWTGSNAVKITWPCNFSLSTPGDWGPEGERKRGWSNRVAPGAVSAAATRESAGCPATRGTG
jgi:hypothetical protein